MNSQYWHQPEIDPVLLHIGGPFQIRWYSLLYVGGFLVGRHLLRRLSRDPRFHFTEEQVENYIMWLLVGTVIGARLVYCLVYDLPTFLNDPFFLLRVYEGGLSFHGGMLGVTIATILFCKKYNIPLWNLADAAALATPTGLAMGRLGNFINGELYGRISYVPWAVVFKHGGVEPRHPSQLYELFLEGVVLFITLWTLKKYLKKDGQLFVAFVIGYPICRFIAEFFRQPDPQLGFLFLHLSMGQLLSLLMLFAGVALGFWLYSTKWRFEGVPIAVAKKSSKKKKRK